MKKFLPFFLLLLAVNSYSAVKTWDGGGADSNWTTAANWVGDSLPIVGDDLVFPEVAAQYTSNNTFVFLSSFRSITIEGGSYTIGGNAVQLTSGMTLTGAHTLNVPISLSGAQTFTVTEGSTATAVFVSTGTSPLTLAGPGTLAIGMISGSGSLTMDGTGAALVFASTGFSGQTRVNSGILVIDANMPGSAVTVNAPLPDPNLTLLSGLGGTGTIGPTTVTQGVISAGTFSSPTGVLNIIGGITFTAAGAYAPKLNGTTPGTGHDQLNVTGSVTLANAQLLPIPWDPYRPPVGANYVILNNDGADPVNGTFLNLPQGATFAGPLNTLFRITYQGGDGNDIAITALARSPFDLDGDGKTDIGIFRPGPGEWWYLRSSDDTNRAFQFGAATDTIAPADYTGDGKTDLAFFRPSTGFWYVLRSEDNTFFGFPFGADGDVPVPGNFDLDTKADAAIYRPSSSTWFVTFSMTGETVAQAFGAPGDKPVPADFDGDGVTDVAVFRPNGSSGSAEWWADLSTEGPRALAFGLATDKAVPGDYTGDGRADVAIWRPSNGTWYVIRSEDFSFYAFPFGAEGDVPAPGDYDGDGKLDAAVFRNGTWYINRSTAGQQIIGFGQTGDAPLASAYVR